MEFSSMPLSHWAPLWAPPLIFFALLAILVPPLGRYIAAIFTGEKTKLHPFLEWLEKGCYKITGVDHTDEMSWVEYAKTLFLFNLIGFLALFLIQLAQSYLIFNPEHFSGVSWALSFSTAASFVTNTNWQSYSGETTLSYGTQMLGLTVQNFLSAATGMAVLLALIRGIIRKSSITIGNFWADLVRTIVYLLLPLSIGLALILISGGVIQTLSPYVEVTTLENGKQMIPLGPVASQVAIKQLGTNGGGFFNANSAHPFENPTPWTNLLEMVALILIPAASVYAYGIMIGSRRHGWLIFIAMAILFLGGIALSFYSEYLPNPILGAYPNLEGKETRLGPTNSILWAIATTATANGSVNAMLSSLSPLAGGVALFNIMLGEIIFGGVGVGLCGMLMHVLLTVFLAGLMVGRTPEYFGKKIEKREMQWVMLALLTPPGLVLIGSGISAILPTALASLGNHGPHGLSEILYAFSSSAGNNGSAFAGLNANTNYYNFSLGIVMILGRISILFPSLAIAGLLAKKKIAPPTLGTFSTNTPLFLILLISVFLIVGALTFFPALALGPVVEHFLMIENRSF